MGENSRITKCSLTLEGVLVKRADGREGDKRKGAEGGRIEGREGGRNDRRERGREKRNNKRHPWNNCRHLNTDHVLNDIK